MTKPSPSKDFKIYLHTNDPKVLTHFQEHPDPQIEVKPQKKDGDRICIYSSNPDLEL